MEAESTMFPGVDPVDSQLSLYSNSSEHMHKALPTTSSDWLLLSQPSLVFTIDEEKEPKSDKRIFESNGKLCASLVGRGLVSVPGDVYLMDQLSCLILSNNRLNALPDGIGQLDNLEVCLYLSNDQVMRALSGYQ